MIRRAHDTKTKLIDIATSTITLIWPATLIVVLSSLIWLAWVASCHRNTLLISPSYDSFSVITDERNTNSLIHISYITNFTIYARPFYSHSLTGRASSWIAAISSSVISIMVIWATVANSTFQKHMSNTTSFSKTSFVIFPMCVIRTILANTISQNNLVWIAELVMTKAAGLRFVHSQVFVAWYACFLYWVQILISWASFAFVSLYVKEFV